VVFAPETGGTYCLLKVLPHDKAIVYAAGHRFSVNEALGVVEVRNEIALEQIQPTLERVAETTSERLFANVSDAERPGVPVLVSVSDASGAEPDEALDLDFRVSRDDIQVQAVLDCLRLRHAGKQPRGVGVAFDRTPSRSVPASVKSDAGELARASRRSSFSPITNRLDTNADLRQRSHGVARQERRDAYVRKE
jgi:hypothetical protein